MVNFIASFIYLNYFIHLHLKNVYIVDERIVIIFVSKSTFSTKSADTAHKNHN